MQRDSGPDQFSSDTGALHTMRGIVPRRRSLIEGGRPVIIDPGRTLSAHVVPPRRPCPADVACWSHADNSDGEVMTERWVTPMSESRRDSPDYARSRRDNSVLRSRSLAAAGDSQSHRIR